MRLGQTDQPADLLTHLRIHVLFGETRAQFLIVGSRGVIDDVVPLDGRFQSRALDCRQSLDARKPVKAILDMSEIVVVPVWRRIGGDQIIARYVSSGDKA